MLHQQHYMVDQKLRARIILQDQLTFLHYLVQIVGLILLQVHLLLQESKIFQFQKENQQIIFINQEI